jgi:hypothetical protein
MGSGGPVGRYQLQLQGQCCGEAEFISLISFFYVSPLGERPGESQERCKGWPVVDTKMSF